MYDERYKMPYRGFRAKKEEDANTPHRVAKRKGIASLEFVVALEQAKSRTKEALTELEAGLAQPLCSVLCWLDQSEYPLTYQFHKKALAFLLLLSPRQRGQCSLHNTAVAPGWVQ